MREIKFRAIDMGGRWVYGDLIHKRTSVGDAMIRCKNGIESDVDIETIGQCTGLKDKNGKEIYEGDILRSYDSTGAAIEHIVGYREGSVVVRLCDFPRVSFTLTQSWIDEFEKYIIGNIHDDKEYLV